MRWRFRAFFAASLLVAGAVTLAAPRPPETVEEAVGSFLETKGIPGAVLVFGPVDGAPTVLTVGEVEADRRLRIASLSKPITAAAVLTLVEQGRLALDTRLADLFPEIAQAPDARHREITIRHLLQHTAGWDWDRSGDPVFSTEGAETCREVATATLRRPLDFPPGERHAYSNLGYCWLGLVVERVTGLDYEAAAHDAVLAPAGAVGMRLGEEQMLRLAWAAAGWTATAEDYFRFLSRPVPAGTVENAVPAPLTPYGLGWRVLAQPEGAALYHNGHLYGPNGSALAFALRTVDGFGLVALFSGGPPYNDRSGMLRLAEAVLRLARATPGA